MSFFKNKMCAYYISIQFLVVIGAPAVLFAHSSEHFCDKSFCTGEWRSSNHDHCNSNNNPRSTKISADNVKHLKLDWISQPDFPQSPVGPLRFPAVTNAIVDDGIVYYNNFFTSLIAAHVSNGSIKWIFTPSQGAAFTGSVVEGEFLYVAGGFFPAPPAVPFVTLFKLRKADASIVWQTQVGNPNTTGETTLAATTVIDDLVIVPTATSSEDDLFPDPKLIGSLNAFNKHTGKLVWQFVPKSGGGTTIESTPAYDTKRKLLFITTSNSTFPPAGKQTDAILAIDYRTGKLRWSHQFTSNDVKFTNLKATAISPNYKDQDALASPNLFNTQKDGKGIDAVGLNSKKGVYTAFDRSTGKIIWKRNVLPGFSVLLGNPSATVSDGTIYTVTSWTKEPRINVGFAAAVANIATFTPSPDQLPIVQYYINIHTNLARTSIFALDAKNGKVKWRKDFKSTVLGSVSQSNGVLYTGTFRGELLAFNAKNGHNLFKFQFPPTFTICLAPPPFCAQTFPNLPPLNFPLVPPNLTGDITIAENKIFVPVGFSDFRSSVFAITNGGLYAFSLHGKAKLPPTPKHGAHQKAHKLSCKELKLPCMAIAKNKRRKLH